MCHKHDNDNIIIVKMTRSDLSNHMYKVVSVYVNMIMIIKNDKFQWV